MNRREFLEMLGMSGVVLVTPKFIFDYGANLYKRELNIEELRQWANVIIDSVMEEAFLNGSSVASPIFRGDKSIWDNVAVHEHEIWPKMTPTGIVKATFKGQKIIGWSGENF